MKNNLMMDFSVDKGNRKIRVKREFAAPLDKVWAAWTQRELLDKWWAPKPWEAKTKSLDFTPGGMWLYAMVGPDGTTHWSRSDYQSINPQESFSWLSAFCDSEGNMDETLSRSNWNNGFNEEQGATFVTIEITYQNIADMEMMIEMGFKEGFTAGLQNLEDLFTEGQL